MAGAADADVAAAAPAQDVGSAAAADPVGAPLPRGAIGAAGEGDHVAAAGSGQVVARAAADLRRGTAAAAHGAARGAVVELLGDVPEVRAVKGVTEARHDQADAVAVDGEHQAAADPAAAAGAL